MGELREREKELACIYQLSRILASLRPPEETAGVVAAALRRALSEPDYASVLVQLDGAQAIDRGIHAAPETLLEPDPAAGAFPDTSCCAAVSTAAGEVGRMCVSYDEAEPEGPARAPVILEHERELLRAVAALLADNSERRRVVEELRAAVAAESRKTVALEEVLTQLEELRRRNLADLRATLEAEVLPLVSQLQEYHRDDAGAILIERLQETLQQLGLDSSERRMAQRRALRARLSPREYEIAGLICSGIPTKQIAETLHISAGTVERHRHSIRRKLGIRNERVNLATYLRNDTELGTPYTY